MTYLQSCSGVVDRIVEVVFRLNHFMCVGFDDLWTEATSLESSLVSFHEWAPTGLPVESSGQNSSSLHGPSMYAIPPLQVEK